VSASRQWLSKVARQTTHSAMLKRSVMGAPQAEPPGTVTAGHSAGKPICAAVTSGKPPQIWSTPPHPAQIPARRFSSRRAILSDADVLAAGHSPESCPLMTPSSHRRSALLTPLK
jgi:hypothetical protein